MTHFQKTLLVLQGCLGLLASSFNLKAGKDAVKKIENQEEILTKIAQRNELLEKFFEKNPLPEGLSKEDFLNKNWNDLMSELRDPPSREFLEKIGVYIKEEGDSENIDYAYIIEKEENRFMDERENPLNNNIGVPEDVFSITPYVSRNPSLRAINIFMDERKKLNAQLNANFKAFLQKDELISEDFYNNFIDYHSQVPETFNPNNFTFSKKFDTFDDLSNANTLDLTLTTNFNRFYISNIYFKLQGVLFDNPDFQKDFTHIRYGGDFREEKFKVLRETLRNAVSRDEALDFSLCAFSFLFQINEHQRRKSPKIFDTYFSLFHNVHDYTGITLDYALTCINEKGKIYYKNLYFKNEGKNYSKSQSLETVDLLSGIGLTKKKLLLRKKAPQNPWSKNLQNIFNNFTSKRKKMLSVLTNYLHQGNNVESSLFSIIAFGAIIMDIPHKDFEHFLRLVDNCFCSSYPSMVNKLKFYTNYSDLPATTLSNHPWIRLNSENFYRHNNQIFKKLALEELENAHRTFSSEYMLREFSKRKALLNQESLKEEQGHEDQGYNHQALLSQKKDNLSCFDYIYCTNFGDIENREEIFVDLARLGFSNYFHNSNEIMRILSDDGQGSLRSFINHLIQGDKESIEGISALKKAFVQEKRKEIAEDFSYMQWFKFFLNKRQIYRKDGSRIEFLNKMGEMGHLIFSYNSHYQIFFKMIEGQKALKNKRALEGKPLFLDEVKNTMAQELAIFYFRNYKNFFIFQGIIGNGNNALKLTYVDPVFLHLKVICHKHLVPCLLDIAKLQYNFEIKEKRPFEEKGFF